MLQSLIIITHHIYKINNAEMEIINVETSQLAKYENDLQFLVKYFNITAIKFSMEKNTCTKTKLWPLEECN
jgi:hypothetical protein